MKLMSMRNFLFAGMVVAGLLSCDKQNSSFTPQGGGIPTNYISILDSSFSPSNITLAVGSSITFVNSSTISHTIISDDTVTIKTPVIVPGSSFFYKKDTVGTFNYHCIEHPGVRGSITLRP